MKLRQMLVNEYTVGGSLLLIGAGFWSTRFTEALGYKLFTIPSMLPLIGGMDVTVGRAAALVPLSLGAAFLLRTIRPVTSKVPVVSNLADIADNIVAEVSKPVASEIKGAEKAAEEVEVVEAESVDQLNPTEVSGNDEEVSFQAEGGKLKWKDAIAQARKDLGITGFSAIKKGTPLYKRAKELSA
ncbi:hypothetical protein N9M03_00510 [bacterium]|nr:hypothetical protein [bacterium]